MEKISGAQAEQLMKTAAAQVRALSKENGELRSERDSMAEKIAHFERKEHAERIATTMEEKGLQSELSFQEKVASLLDREDLKVVEEALRIGAPAIKVASVDEDGVTGHEPGAADPHGDIAQDNFLSGLME